MNISQTGVWYWRHLHFIHRWLNRPQHKVSDYLQSWANAFGENTVRCYLHQLIDQQGFLVSSRSVINHLRNCPRPWFAAWSLHSIIRHTYIYIQGVVQLCYPLLSLITNQDLHVEYHVPLREVATEDAGLLPPSKGYNTDDSTSASLEVLQIAAEALETWAAMVCMGNRWI